MVVLQNRGSATILMGDASTQNHLLPVDGIRVLTADEIALGVWARASAGTSTLNIWEFSG
jgi:hypothetical protein